MGSPVFSQDIKGFKISKDAFRAPFFRTQPALTVFIHGCDKALVEPTGAALVPVRLVNGTAALQVALRLARVHPVAVDAALEEPRTAIAAVDAVVFAR